MAVIPVHMGLLVILQKIREVYGEPHIMYQTNPFETGVTISPFIVY